LSHLFKLTFWRLTLRPQNGLVIGTIDSHSSSPSPTSSLSSASTPGVQIRVSNLSFLSVVLFLWRADFFPFSV
jgi:hypothetical protein